MGGGTWHTYEIYVKDSDMINKVEIKRVNNAYKY
jgi:hypothetical protein